MRIRTLAWLLWLTGLGRIRHGYCPACNSSPPIPWCAVCQGGPYGDAATPEVKALWRERWDRLRAVFG